MGKASPSSLPLPSPSLIYHLSIFEVGREFSLVIDMTIFCFAVKCTKLQIRMFITVCTKQNTSSLGDSIELFLHLEDSLLSDFNLSQRQMLKNLHSS